MRRLILGAHDICCRAFWLPRAMTDIDMPVGRAEKCFEQSGDRSSKMTCDSGANLE
jgi:hypothetical protein